MIMEEVEGGWERKTDSRRAQQYTNWEERRRARGHINQLCNYKTTNEFNRRGVGRLKGGARRLCSLLSESLKAKEAGEHVSLHLKVPNLGFQLLKLDLKLQMTQELVEQVCQYTEGVLNIWESETYALVKYD